MRTTDKERILELFESSIEQLDRSAVYDAIALAERDESDPKTKQLLHDAALALMRAQLDKKHLDTTRGLLESIETGS